VRGRVDAARVFGAGRGGSSRSLSGVALLRACCLDARGKLVVERVARTHHLSGRGVTRLLRVARTIADCARESTVAEEHVLEAACYRVLQ
jgi:magnesium chelatase family protein